MTCVASPPVVVFTPAVASGRVLSIDWMRGLAVLVMIECHSLVFLAKPWRNGWGEHALTQINGLVAPAFILVAGFVLALLMGKAAADPDARRKRARSSLWRIVQVLLAANLMRFEFKPVFHDPSWFWRVDILSCIAYTLLVVWLVMRISRAHLWLAASLLTALFLAVLACEPFAEAYAGPSVFGHLLNNKTGSDFPLTPCSAFLLLGAVMGVLAARLGSSTKHLFGLWAMVLVFGWSLWQLQLPIERLYNGYPTYWLPAFGDRMWQLALAGMGLLLLERCNWNRATGILSLPRKLLAFFGSMSLSAYVIHLLLLYGVRFGSAHSIQFTEPLHDRCGWPGYWAMTLVVITATGLLCRVLALPAQWRKDRQRPIPQPSPLEVLQ